MRRSLRHALAVALLVGTAEVAHAHPLVDRAAEAHAQAEFERALELLDRAESSDDLTRDDVVALLYQRALSTYALGRLDEMERSLQRLVALEPHHPLSPTMPPEIRASLERLEADAEGPLSVEARVEREEGAARVEASVFRDEGGLVRRVRLAARPEGGPWQVVDDTSLRLAADDGQTVEFWAQAIGPGRAVLASAGSAAAPLRDAPAPPPEQITSPTPRAPPSEGGSNAWPWIAAGGAAAVAIGALVLLLVTAGAAEDGTQLTSPMLELQWSP